MQQHNPSINPKYLGLLAVVLLILWPRLSFIFYPYLDLDHAEAIYHAQKILSGDILYRDSFTHHHPGAILGALLPLIFGIEPPFIGSLVSTVTIVISSAIIYFWLLHRCSILVALSASLINGLVYLAADLPFYPQHIIICFLSFLLFFQIDLDTELSKLKAFLWGLVFGALIVADQRSLTCAFPIALLSMLYHRRVAAYLVLGVFAPLIISLLYLFFNQALPDYWYQCWVFPASVRTGDFSLVKFLDTSFSLHHKLYLHLAPLLPIVLYGYLQSFYLKSTNWKFHVWFFSWSICLYLYAASGQQTFDHYLMVWIPFLSILSAFAFERLEKRFNTLGRCLIIFFTFLCCFKSLIAPFKTYASYGSYFIKPPTSPSEITARYLQSEMSASDDLYVWGYNPQLYLYTGKQTSFRQLNQLAITGGEFDSEFKGKLSAERKQNLEEFKQYLNTRPPRFFIIYDNPFLWKTRPDRIFAPYFDPEDQRHEVAQFVLKQIKNKYALKAIFSDDAGAGSARDKFWVFELRRLSF